MSAEMEAFKRLELLSVTYPGEPWALSAGEGHSPSKAKDGDYSKRLKQALAAHPPEPGVDAGGNGSKPRNLTFSERWQALEVHADAVSREAWPLMKATASLANSASELDLQRLSARNFEQLLEGAQRRQRPTAAPLGPGDGFTVQRTPWAVDGVFRHGLNLLVGQPGAGKSRLAAAAIAAWLRGDQTWLSRDMPCDLPVEDRHALIIGTDQGLEDWALTLEPVGLVMRDGPSRVRLHPRLTLHPLETGTALDADGLATIRRWCDAHPHGAVLIDSLAATLPPGIDEDKSAAARPVHALAEALGSCWAVLTHHMRKGAGKDQNLGVGAGRGSSAIDGAVSRVVGLGLIHKMENGILTPQESDPRREILSTKRGGATLHLIIRSDASGYWSNEGSAEDLKRAERKERTLAKLTDAQSSVVGALEDASGWLTGRQVAEALLDPGETYDARGSHAAATRKTLKRLEVLGLIETMRAGLDRLYRVPDPQAQSGSGVSHPSQSPVDEFDSTGSNGSKTAVEEISAAHPVALTGSHWLSPVTASGEPSEPVVIQGVLSPVAAMGEPPEPVGEPVGEPVRTVALQRESQESHPLAHTAAAAGSPGLAVTVEGEGGWWLPSGRIPRSGNTVAIDPEGRSHHVAAVGIQLDLARRAA